MTHDLWDLLPGAQATTTMTRMAARQQCEREGHRYRVHGRSNPARLECTRCEVTWAIGPRTEPRS